MIRHHHNHWSSPTVHFSHGRPLAKSSSFSDFTNIDCKSVNNHHYQTPCNLDFRSHTYLIFDASFRFSPGILYSGIKMIVGGIFTCFEVFI
ncbi:hypothetical protein L2E82_04545 [Cichorium intybus]|uniref:Uncharacterized protein n=1 Tax=Cichorium intybus TaxID=13427 RepID=A0ACB9H5K7_CICIN|nr:hypothetical protein L2E82_04545 [Cichorium intybus]